VEFRRLGKTELTLSRIGFGAASLGDVYFVIDPAEGLRAVHMAIDEGINFFDVAPYYGKTLAEERLGKALAGKRENVVLATKCGRYDVTDFDFSASTVRAGLEASLTRLGTEYVDLLQVHDVEFGDYAQIVHETLPELARLKAEGKIRYIGITGYPLGMLARILKEGPVDSVLTYCRYNLMITDMDDLLTPVAQQNGVGLINASALNMGILTARGASDWHPAPEGLRAVGQHAVKYAEQRGVRLSNQALRFCFDHPYVSSTLVGMSTRKHVRENLEALADTSDLEFQKELRRIFGEYFNYVWPSGRPENCDAQCTVETFLEKQ
jgi:L-galactose dehydrogenase